MRTSDPKMPYLFHTSRQGMESGKPCGTTVFHTFHTFHTCFSRVHVGRAHAPGQAQAHTGARTHAHLAFLGMEGMEGMEEGHRTMVFSFHTSATPRQGMEPQGDFA